MRIYIYMIYIYFIYLPYQLVIAGFLNHQQYLLWISESKTSKRSKTMFQLQVMLTASFHRVGSKLRLQRKERSWLGRNAGWGTNPIRFQKFLLPQHKASKAMCGSIGSNLSSGIFAEGLEVEWGRKLQTENAAFMPGKFNHCFHSFIWGVPLRGFQPSASIFQLNRIADSMMWKLASRL